MVSSQCQLEISCKYTKRKVHKLLVSVNLLLSPLDQWDCIACSFFIDTAHNVIEYIENIYNILKPGGVWINFGKMNLSKAV